MLRHLESLTVLAREDLVLAPSANLIARSIFETSIRARWMFIPLDPYEREVRWVLFLRSGATHAKKLVQSNYTPSIITTIYEDRWSRYAEFDTNICEKLDELGYTVPKQAPNVWEMLKELSEPQLYYYYVLLSAYTHSNFEAASLYKRGLGGSKQIGEFTSTNDWWLPFDVAWKSFFLAARDFLLEIEADVSAFERDADVREFERILAKLINPS